MNPIDAEQMQRLQQMEQVTVQRSVMKGQGELIDGLTYLAQMAAQGHVGAREDLRRLKELLDGLDAAASGIVPVGRVVALGKRNPN